MQGSSVFKVGDQYVYLGNQWNSGLKLTPPGPRNHDLLYWVRPAHARLLPSRLRMLIRSNARVRTRDVPRSLRVLLMFEIIDY